MSKASVEAQRQLDRIVALGYPDVADVSAAAFRSLARPLIEALEHTDFDERILLAPTRELVSPESLISRTSINRMAGFATMPPRDIASFLPQDGFEPPEGPFYIVVEPRTGTKYTQTASPTWPASSLTPTSAFRSRSRGTGHRHAASGLASGEKRVQPAGLAQRRRPRAQHLAESERPEARCGVAEFQAHVAWQRILHGPQGRLAVPLVSGLRGLSGPRRLPADLLPLLSI